MSIAFLYAGQGSQHAGMGKDLYESYPEFREVYEGIELPFDLRRSSLRARRDLFMRRSIRSRPSSPSPAA